MVLGTSLASSTREALPNSDSIIKEPIQAVVGTLALPLTLMPGSGSFVPGILPDQAQVKFTQLETKFWMIFGPPYSSSCSAIRAAVPSFSRTKHKAKVVLDSGSKCCDCGNFILSKGWGDGG